MLAGQIVDLRPELRVDHRLQELLDRRRVSAGSIPPMPHGCGATVAAPGRAPAPALGGRIELALAAVARPLHLHDVAGVDQLLQHARQALLGDLQHVEQVGHRQPGLRLTKCSTR